MICGISGILSSGKTNLAVMCVIEDWKQLKRKVISNCRLNGIPYEYMTNELIIDLVNRAGNGNGEIIKNKFNNSIFLMDEASNLVNSRRSSSKINEKILQLILMLGKLSINCYYTYQLSGSSQIDVIFRELTPLTIRCEKIDEKGRIVLFGDRILDYKTFIKCNIELRLPNVLKKATMIIDGSPYWKYYDTQELMFINRDLYTGNYWKKKQKSESVSFDWDSLSLAES